MRSSGFIHIASRDLDRKHIATSFPSIHFRIPTVTRTVVTGRVQGNNTDPVDCFLGVNPGSISISSSRGCGMELKSAVMVQSASEPAADGGKFANLDADGNAGAKSKTRLPITDPNWQWPIFELFENKHGQSEEKERGPVDPKKDGADSPFKLVYRRKKLQVWPDEVKITLSSRPLIKILQEYLPDDGDLKCMANPPVEGRQLFVILDSLRSHIHSQAKAGLEDGLPSDAAGEFKRPEIDNGDDSEEAPQELSAEDEAKAGELHLKHLVRCLEMEYKETAVRARRMREEKRTTWDMLWAFLPPGSKVVYHCDHSQELLCAVVSANHYTFCNGWLFVIELDVWDYDGRRYDKCKLTRTVGQYKGEKSLTGQPVCPIELMGLSERLEEAFLANGRTFYDLGVKHSHRFMHYTGAMFQKQQMPNGSWAISKKKADGRVMIDLASFSKMNPSYPMGNAQPPNSSMKFFMGIGGPPSWKYGGMNMMRNGNMPLDWAGAVDSEVSDESLIFAPAIVYGFSFALKQWGSFAVSRFQEIRFDRKAFEELTMDTEMKGLVHKLVSQYVATPGDGNKRRRVDPIAQKGEGCVLLCHGPPGSGKTLTAESVAENLERPLWSLSVSELGTSPKTLEETLTKVLDVAATWRAVLLLDEAETYLEKRESGDLQRNAMTGVFLRLLEYYRGVLFLTTNRVGTFDEAFRSRISIFLHYKQLGVEDRVKVWRTLLQRGGVDGGVVEFCEEVATKELNGREIRNIIHMAQVLADSADEPVAVQHVRDVMKVLVTSMDSLDQAISNAQ